MHSIQELGVEGVGEDEGFPSSLLTSAWSLSFSKEKDGQASVFRRAPGVLNQARSVTHALTAPPRMMRWSCSAVPQSSRSS